MQTFRVQAVHRDTGTETVLELPAADPRAAATQAMQMGYVVGKVDLPAPAPPPQPVAAAVPQPVYIVQPPPTRPTPFAHLSAILWLITLVCFCLGIGLGTLACGTAAIISTVIFVICKLAKS